MPTSLNDHLADRFLMHQVDLLRVEAGTREQILTILREAERNLNDQIARRLPADADTGPTFTQRRLDALLKQVRTTIQGAYREADATSHKAMLGWAEIERDRTRDTMNGALDMNLLTVGVPQSTLEAIVKDDIVQGSPARAWWGRQAIDTYEAYRNVLQDAIVRNQTPDEVMRRVRGTKAANYQDGVMRLPKHQASALVRTSLQSVANHTRHTVLMANRDVLRGIGLQVTLDTRTSDICRALAGACWDMDGNPLPESPRQERYPGPPPYHYQCRTTEIPIVKNYMDLIAADKTEAEPEIVEAPETEDARALEQGDAMPEYRGGTPIQQAMIGVVDAYIRTTGKTRTLLTTRTARGTVSGALDLDLKKTFAEIKGLAATSAARGPLLRDAAQRALGTRNKRLTWLAPAEEQAALLADGWEFTSAGKVAGADTAQMHLSKDALRRFLQAERKGGQPAVSARQARDLRRLPPSQQASMDGQVAGSLDYEGWLRGKSPSFQRKVLGQKKFDAWQKGEIALRDLIDQSHRPRTIDEMRAIMAQRGRPPAPPAPPPAPAPAPPPAPAPAPAAPPQPKAPPKPRAPKSPKPTPPPAAPRGAIGPRERPYFRFDAEEIDLDNLNWHNEQITRLEAMIKEAEQRVANANAYTREFFRKTAQEKRQELATHVAARDEAIAKILPHIDIPPALTEAGRHLQQDTVTKIGKLANSGANQSFKVDLESGARGVWKPMDGEEGLRRGLNAGEYFIREALSSEIAARVGMSDLVPETVVRTIGSRVGSVQKFLEGYDTASNLGGRDATGSSSHDIRRAFLFNLILGNTDRHVGNWMVGPGGKIALIDNGLNLSRLSTDRIRIHYGRGLNVGIDAQVPAELQTTWKEAWPDVKQLMQNYGIDKTAIELAEERWRLVTKAGVHWRDLLKEVWTE